MGNKYIYIQASSLAEINIAGEDGFRVHSVKFSEGGNIRSVLMEKVIR